MSDVKREKGRKEDGKKEEREPGLPFPLSSLPPSSMLTPPHDTPASTESL